MENSVIIKLTEYNKLKEKAFYNATELEKFKQELTEKDFRELNKLKFQLKQEYKELYIEALKSLYDLIMEDAFCGFVSVTKVRSLINTLIVNSRKSELMSDINRSEK